MVQLKSPLTGDLVVVDEDNYEIIERKSDMDKKEKLQKIITDCQSTLEKAQAELKQLEETTYSIGDRFVYNGEKYILARFKTDVVSLIPLASGNRWQDPTAVKNDNEITQSEFDKICGNDKFIRYKEAKATG